MFKLIFGGIGVAAIMVLVIIAIIVGKIFGKPIGFLFKLAGILIGLLIVAGAILCSMPYLLIGGIIAVLAVVLFKLLFHKSKG